MKIESRARDLGVGAGLVLLVFFALEPYWTNGIWSDDLLNSNIWGSAYLTGEGLGGSILRSLRVWLFEKGRLFPLSSVVTDVSFYFVRDPEWIRKGQVAAALVHAGLWTLWIRRYTGDARVSWITLLSLPLFLQMRFYHDGLASFFPLLQIVGIELALCLLGLLSYLRNGSWAAYALSLLAFESSLLTYEISYALLPMLWLVVSTERSNVAEKRRLFLPFFALSLVTFAFWVALKQWAPNPYAATQFRWNLGRIIGTAFRQASGNIPLLHEIGLVSGFEGIPKLLMAALASPVSVALMAAYGAAFYFLLGGSVSKLPRGIWRVLFFVCLVPSLITGLSGQRQAEISWGRSYIPDYLTAGSCAALLACGLHKGWSRFARLGWGVLLALVMGVQRQANFGVAAVTDEKFWNDRAVLTRVLREGILDGLPDRAPLIVAPLPTGVTEAYFPVHCRCAIRFVAENSPAYRLQFSREGKQLVSAELFDADGKLIKKISAQ